MPRPYIVGHHGDDQRRLAGHRELLRWPALGCAILGNKKGTRRRASFFWPPPAILAAALLPTCPPTLLRATSCGVGGGKPPARPPQAGSLRCAHWCRWKCVSRSEVGALHQEHQPHLRIELARGRRACRWREGRAADMGGRGTGVQTHNAIVLVRSTYCQYHAPRRSIRTEKGGLHGGGYLSSD